ERRLAGESVKVDRTDGLTGFGQRAVKHGILNARVGELIVVDLVVEAPGELIRRHPQDVAMEDLLVDTAVVQAGRQVVHIPVAKEVRDGPLRQQLVGDRDVDGSFYVAPVERTDGA